MPLELRLIRKERVQLHGQVSMVCQELRKVGILATINRLQICGNCLVHPVVT
jgi:hypothetical protein